MSEEKKIKVIPLADGAAHLQNDILSNECYICKKEVTEESVLVRYKGNDMVFACLDHPGVVQLFIEQYKIPPMGWYFYKQEEA